MNRTAAERFIDVLEARHGIIAVVGAGGKKSTLHRLIEAHRLVETDRVALTTTVKMAPAAASLELPMVIEKPASILSAVRSSGKSKGSVLIAGPMTTAKRLSGLPSDLISSVHVEGGFDVTLVKADGARMRLIKAPGDNEPVLPDDVTTILPMVSARVFGKQLAERIVHRPERLMAIMDAEMGVDLAPHHVARLLTSGKGTLHRVGKARVVPIINMVDTPDLQILAKETAEIALAATNRFDRIILASMLTTNPLIEVVRRKSISWS